MTGGTRGIGAGICHSLMGQGATVAAGYSRDREKAEAFLAELSERGGQGSVHQGNVGSADDCRRTIAEVIERYGHLDILVNNAGITIDRTVLKMTDEDWFKVMAVNLSGAFFLSQALLPHMIERAHGRIVNISSIIGEQGNIGQANYAASKSGLFGLTKTLAREAAFQLQRAGTLTDAGLNVTVNCVAPGFIVTEMLEAVPEGAAAHLYADSAGAAGPGRRGRASCPLPLRRCLLVHNRSDLGRQRRDGHVGGVVPPS